MNRRSFLGRLARSAAALVALTLVARFKPEPELVAYWDDVALERIATMRKGKLLAVGRFPSPRWLLATDDLQVEYTLRLEDQQHTYLKSFKCTDGARADAEGECGLTVPPGPVYGAYLREYDDGERLLSVFTHDLDPYPVIRSINGRLGPREA